MGSGLRSSVTVWRTRRSTCGFVFVSHSRARRIASAVDNGGSVSGIHLGRLIALVRSTSQRRVRPFGPEFASRRIVFGAGGGGAAGGVPCIAKLTVTVSTIGTATPLI